MEKIRDYNNYDKLVLYVKDKKTKKVIENYSQLGWELVSSVCNHKYRNIMDLTFVRPHNIKNKDELQLLQVKMEEKINREEKLKTYKYSKTIAFSLTSITIGVLCIILSIVQFINTNLKIKKVLSFLLMGIGIIIFVVIYYILPKIYIKETLKYEKEIGNLDKEIKEINLKVKDLRGDKSGKN